MAYESHGTQVEPAEVSQAIDPGAAWEQAQMQGRWVLPDDMDAKLTNAVAIFHGEHPNVIAPSEMGLSGGEE